MPTETESPPRNPLDLARFNTANLLIIYGALIPGLVSLTFAPLIGILWIPLCLILWIVQSYFIVRWFLRLNRVRQRWITALTRAGLVSVAAAVAASFLLLPIGLVFPAAKDNPFVYFALTVTAFVATIGISVGRIRTAGWLDPNAAWDDRPL